MMTCRLLCALLVLALCCCPSLCVADTQSGPEAGLGVPDPSPSSPLPPIGNSDDPNVKATSLLTPLLGLPEEEPPAPGSTGSSSTGSVLDEGNVDGEGPGVTAGEAHSNMVPNTVQGKGKDGTTGGQSATNTSADKAAREAKDAAQKTTTTTTQAPTTTTTTAPEAPSTTTTEAPATTTTTRAPSRLREIDGSLSSSAWVCAPLVLAASALAYTALG
ncbi:putative mucin TcMUCII [Trypanosoma cruzi]|uniref:Mucin TcMUCII, putative n=2 Tax=Trypanosoma cruzi TaxID=5693 RepID=Q4DNG8_TRYCC|nr:mucin TcMUCII, putative [Trypanosoma cruzi]EAN94064.1 mucin TcMUCII, putative [Trypanosoma cruzi]PWV15825.1 putative mucin TcMUCII [Trypanosoma cruzi]|eukprot:XP_815915.1 mucin TcMUCII [Trypanosoma cruzi strain CL Brener]